MSHSRTLANIEGWARSHGHDLSRTLMFSYEGFPDLSSFDWLIIMGGPMNIYDHERYPWLVRVKEFIRRTIAGGKDRPWDMPGSPAHI